MILERRNHPEVRKWMIHTEPISREEHLRYCASLKERPDIMQLLVEFDGQPACVLSYKATDASWQEIKDCGIYAFAPEPCTSSVLSLILKYHLIVLRGIKTFNIAIRSDNEMALFATQYYQGFQLPHQDEHLTYMTMQVDQEPSFYQAQRDQLLDKLHATLELQL